MIAHEFEINPPAIYCPYDKRPNLSSKSIPWLHHSTHRAINQSSQCAPHCSGIPFYAGCRWGLPSGYNLWLGTENPPPILMERIWATFPLTPEALNYKPNLLLENRCLYIFGSAANCPVGVSALQTRLIPTLIFMDLKKKKFPWGEWQTEIIAGESGFQKDEFISQPTTSPHTGGWMGYYNCRNLPNGNSARLISPPVDRTPQNYTYNVSFWMFRDSGYSTRADRINIWHGRSDLLGAELLGTINRSRSLTPVETSNGWYQYSFPLPAGQTDFVIFEASRPMDTISLWMTSSFPGCLWGNASRLCHKSLSCK